MASSVGAPVKKREMSDPMESEAFIPKMINRIPTASIAIPNGLFMVCPLSGLFRCRVPCCLKRATPDAAQDVGFSRPGNCNLRETQLPALQLANSGPCGGFGRLSNRPPLRSSFPIWLVPRWCPREIPRGAVLAG
jgi:hypothetical protein